MYSNGAQYAEQVIITAFYQLNTKKIGIKYEWVEKHTTTAVIEYFRFRLRAEQ